MAKSLDNTKMKKGIFYLILFIILAFTALFMIGYFYLPDDDHSVSGPDTAGKIDKTDLLYSADSWGGLCKNNKGEDVGCYTKRYLYSTGKFFDISGWKGLGDSHEEATTEKQLKPEQVNEIIGKINDSGIMKKDCKAATILDAGWDYEIQLAGQDKSFHNPEDDCQNLFKELDQTIDNLLSDTIPTNWKTFTAPEEGFTLKYPNNWTLVNDSNGNCGHMKLNGSECRDRYYFRSPDGILVSYVIFSDENNDRLGCGAQGECYADNVIGLENLDVKNFGQVLLIKEDNKNKPYTPPFQVYLHKPLSQQTTPVIGENKYKDHMIFFSLPSKLGGRYALFLAADIASDGTTKFDNLTQEQFFNLDSVKKAILAIKSVSY